MPSGSLRPSSELPTRISPSVSRILNVLSPQVHLGNAQAPKISMSTEVAMLVFLLPFFLSFYFFFSRKKECQASASQPSQAHIDIACHICYLCGVNMEIVAHILH